MGSMKQMKVADRELVAQTIRTNLNLIKITNARPWTDGLVFRRVLLFRGIEVLGRKGDLTLLERSNLRRFNDKWG